MTPPLSRLFARLRWHKGVSLITPLKRGLGPSALCINGAIFAAVSEQEQLLLRLPRPRVAELVLAGRGKLLELTHGHPMREWLVIADFPDDRVLWLAEEALAFVGGL